MKLTFTTLLCALFLLLIPLTLHAAVITFVVPQETYSLQDEFLVEAYIDTEGESLNAIEGTITFPSEIVELTEIRDSDSIVTFWIERPTVGVGNAIRFSGITPGGYTSPHGRLLSFVFRATSSGTGRISITDMQGVQNNEEASLAKMKVTSYAFSVSSIASGSTTTERPLEDTTPPEIFNVRIARDQEAYGGKAFLVFATQDKGSGLDHYEVKEGMWGHYKEASSPYVLEDQKLDKKVFIKAVDKNGNERISVAYPEQYRPWYKDPFILGVITLLIVLGFHSRRRKSF